PPPGPPLGRPPDADPVATTVESFLDALLAGQADPTPYMAPDADIPMASTPPFVEVAVVGIATQEQDNGDLDVWVDVQATSPAGRAPPRRRPRRGATSRSPPSSSSAPEPTAGRSPHCGVRRRSGAHRTRAA